MEDFTLVGDPTLDDTLFGKKGKGPFELVSKIAITSSRDHTTDGLPLLNQGEIYLINPDGTDPLRLTDNTYFDAFPMLSPDGKMIVFDSNRLTADSGQPLNTSDLFVMDADGTNEVLLTRGSSATWSPHSNFIAFHASASYYKYEGTQTGIPINGNPGAATTDSDIFVANFHALAAVDDVGIKTHLATNITNTEHDIEDDPDWSVSTPTAPNGLIVFTSHPDTDRGLPNNNYPTAEIYVMNPDGTGRHQLTDNLYEERGPSWSPDGTKILFSARIGGPDFEICVMNADGSGFEQLTDNSVGDLTASWSPDGTQIAWHQTPASQMFTMNADGTHQTQVTFGPGLNLLAQWGEVRTATGSDPGDGADEASFAGSQADYSIQNLRGGPPPPPVPVTLPDAAIEPLTHLPETANIPDWFIL
jgi:Tol biopolymer transport system component